MHTFNNSNNLKRITIKKGDILQKPGDLNGKIYMVESGLLRSYIIDEKGKIHIFLFANEGYIISDYMPPEKPCELFIDALEYSVIIKFEKDISYNHNAQKLIKRLNIFQKRIIMLMSASAIERYRHFIETYPNIAQRVPQRMIASYLGITPEALSRVKNRHIMKNTY